SVKGIEKKIDVSLRRLLAFTLLPIMVYCIPSDPDITGIGVRAAIYIQNFFTLIPSARVLWDGKITRNEIDAIEEQSFTTLITAFALLFTTIIQTRSKLGIKFNTSDVSAVLNLSWMNNTNVLPVLEPYVVRYQSRALVPS
ncbi:hypothetical protein C0991_009209, partial [Blastosporella zonata]